MRYESSGVDLLDAMRPPMLLALRTGARPAQARASGQHAQQPPGTPAITRHRTACVSGRAPWEGHDAQYDALLGTSSAHSLKAWGESLTAPPTVNVPSSTGQEVSWSLTHFLSPATPRITTTTREASTYLHSISLLLPLYPQGASLRRIGYLPWSERALHGDARRIVRLWARDHLTSLVCTSYVRHKYGAALWLSTADNLGNRPRWQWRERRPSG